MKKFSCLIAGLFCVASFSATGCTPANEIEISMQYKNGKLSRSLKSKVFNSNYEAYIAHLKKVYPKNAKWYKSDFKKSDLLKTPPTGEGIIQKKESEGKINETHPIKNDNNKTIGLNFLVSGKFSPGKLPNDIYGSDGNFSVKQNMLGKLANYSEGFRGNANEFENINIRMQAIDKYFDMLFALYEMKLGKEKEFDRFKILNDKKFRAHFKNIALISMKHTDLLYAIANRQMIASQTAEKQNDFELDFSEDDHKLLASLKEQNIQILNKLFSKIKFEDDPLNNFFRDYRSMIIHAVIANRFANENRKYNEHNFEDIQNDADKLYAKFEKISPEIKNVELHSAEVKTLAKKIGLKADFWKFAKRYRDMTIKTSDRNKDDKFTFSEVFINYINFNYCNLESFCFDKSFYLHRNDFGDILKFASAKLKVKFACPCKPVSTNGTWDKRTKTIYFKRYVTAYNKINTYLGRPYYRTPETLFATWAEPNEKVQKKLFGKVIFKDEKLAEYILWHEKLPAEVQKKWDSALKKVSPKDSKSLSALQQVNDIGTAGFSYIEYINQMLFSKNELYESEILPGKISNE